MTNTVPRELTGNRRTIEDDPERAGDLILERGQYRISARIPYADDRPVYDRELMAALPIEGEHKRVWVYKLSIVPLEEEIDGEQLAQLTAVVHVVDNPLPLAPIIWGTVFRVAPWIAGSVGAWFVVDKVESFATESVIGALLTSAAAVAGLLLLWNTFAEK